MNKLLKSTFSRKNLNKFKRKRSYKLKKIEFFFVFSPRKKNIDLDIFKACLY